MAQWNRLMNGLILRHEDVACHKLIATLHCLLQARLFQFTQSARSLRQLSR